jgi:hypothetical protein
LGAKMAKASKELIPSSLVLFSPTVVFTLHQNSGSF